MRLLQKLYEISHDGFAKVELKSKFLELSFNVIMRMINGKKYFGEDEESDEAKKFQGLIRQTFEHASASNPGDFLRVLRWLDYKSFEKSLARISMDMDVFFQGLVEERRSDKTKNTMIDHLQTLQESQPKYYKDEAIKAMIMVLLLAGTDTSSATIEWAGSLLLNHPKVSEKAKAELETHVGIYRLIQEDDLSKLPYVHNIILETLRLFLAVPHKSSASCKVGGYDFQGGKILLVNTWSIHRDPKVWDDPTSFKPERFEGLQVETSKLMPFVLGLVSRNGPTRIIGFLTIQ
ncbi:cytochrome P450 81E8-like [Coffea eugenioides]|uniref:cytochrome P450 81E8-like n=1 Tax=Coffea eugenioides TaxID=49369 RepID=UPI000F60DAAB|nr:cytochrome P450 81E8-like [Coffea eugenioides]